MERHMDRNTWQFISGCLFTLGLLIVFMQLLRGTESATDLVGFGALMGGGLLFAALLPQLSEFAIGPNGVSGKLNELNRKMDAQQELMKKLIETSMSPEVFHHLAGIAVLREYKYWQNHSVGDLFQREFYFLKLRGFIGPRTQEFFAAMNDENLVGKVELTEIGWIYLKMRKDLVPSGWLQLPNRANLNVEVARSIGLKIE